MKVYFNKDIIQAKIIKFHIFYKEIIDKQVIFALYYNFFVFLKNLNI
jgi:hypothetical protein